MSLSDLRWYALGDVSQNIWRRFLVRKICRIRSAQNDLKTSGIDSWSNFNEKLSGHIKPSDPPLPERPPLVFGISDLGEGVARVGVGLGRSDLDPQIGCL